MNTEEQYFTQIWDCTFEEVYLNYEYSEENIESNE